MIRPSRLYNPQFALIIGRIGDGRALEPLKIALNVEDNQQLRYCFEDALDDLYYASEDDD
jgi:hypothetical protein